MALAKSAVGALNRQIEDFVRQRLFDEAFDLLAQLDREGYEWWMDLAGPIRAIPPKAWERRPMLLMRRLIPLCWAGRSDEALAFVAMLERISAEPGGPDPQLVLEMKASVWLTLRRDAEVVKLLTPISEGEDQAKRCDALNNLGSAYLYLGAPLAEVESVWNRAAEEARDAGRMAVRGACLFNLLWYVLIPQGRYEEAAATLEALGKLSLIRTRIHRAWYAIARGILAHDTGSGNVERQLSVALGWAKRLREPETIEAVGAMLAVCRLAAGDRRSAERTAKSVARDGRPTAARPILAAALAACNEPQGVPTPASEPGGSPAVPSLAQYECRALLLAARSALVRGDRRAAVPPANDAEAIARQHGMCGLAESASLLSLAAEETVGPESLRAWVRCLASSSIARASAKGLGREAATLLQLALTLNIEPDAARKALAEIGLPALRVESFGGFRVWLGDREVAPDGWRRRSSRSLLALLLLRESHSIEVDEAASLLWPDADGDQAVMNLKVAEATLRVLLEPGQPARRRSRFLRREGDLIVFDAGVGATIDFREALRVTERRDRDSALALARHVSGTFMGFLKRELWAAPYLEFYEEVRRDLWCLALQAVRGEAARTLARHFLAEEPGNKRIRAAYRAMDAATGEL